MKSSSRLIFRKMRNFIPQMLGIILLLTVGVVFFVTLFTIVTRYEETAERFIQENSYADVTFYGAFNYEDVRLLAELDSVLLAEGRVVRDFRNDEQIIRAISLTEEINTLHLYDGRLPINEIEGVLLKQNAKAMNLTVGDAIVVGNRELQITGVAYSPEYIYLVQNERTPMAIAETFGIVFVIRDFFPGNDNEIIVMTDEDFDVAEVGQMIDVAHSLQQHEQVSYQMYRDDLEQFTTFAYIFPSIFAILIVVVIYIVLSRTIQKERNQIGTMKALGATDLKIISIYLLPFCFIAFIGAMIGCLSAIFLTNVFINIFSAMFVVPTLSFTFYPLVWLGTIVASIVLCALSSLIALVKILPLMPACTMRPRLPKGGNKLFIERFNFLWNNFTFNTRYALKNSFRNKGRFLAVVLGMAGSCTLLMFSLGFNDSLINTVDEHFTYFVNYDIMINFDPMPNTRSHPALEQLDDGAKVLMIPVEIADENHVLAITENDFDMVNIPVNYLQNGIIIPKFFADLWEVGVGDTLYVNDYPTIVSAVVPQFLEMVLFTSFDYFNQIAENVPPIYNTIFGRTADFSELSSYLIENDIYFSTIHESLVSLDQVMESLSVLIIFLITCSIILGFTVLYAVGLINLSAREYEYMFMGVMGYAHGSILAAHLKETIVQLVLAIPIGFLLGNLILESIRGEFSGNGFSIAITIFSQSYVISALLVVGIVVLMAFVTSRHIEKLDIASGLKAQDN